ADLESAGTKIIRSDWSAICDTTHEPTVVTRLAGKQGQTGRSATRSSRRPLGMGSGDAYRGLVVRNLPYLWSDAAGRSHRLRDTTRNDSSGRSRVCVPN